MNNKNFSRINQIMIHPDLIHPGKFYTIAILLFLSIEHTYGQFEGGIFLGNSISKFWGPSASQSQFKIGISGDLTITCSLREKSAIMAGIGILELGDQFTKDDLHYSVFRTMNTQINISFLRRILKQNKYELHAALGVTLSKLIESAIKFDTPNSTSIINGESLVKDYDLGIIAFLNNRYRVKKSVYIQYTLKFNLGLINVLANSSSTIYNIALINQIGVALPLSNTRTRVHPN